LRELVRVKVRKHRKRLVHCPECATPMEGITIFREKNPPVILYTCTKCSAYYEEV